MRKKFISFGLVVLLIANFFAWRMAWDLAGPGRLEVVFFDVGQGDAIFITSPQGRQILIDAGPSGPKILEKLGAEMPFWDKTIDLIILTHPDYDHLRGLLDVLDTYKVENILWTGVLWETETFKKWQEKIKQEEANIVIAQRGQRIKLSTSEVDSLEILHPFESIEGQLFEKNSNDSSIVARLTFGNASFLFTGDITKKVKMAILQTGDDLAVEILKIAHHGSKTSSAPEFIKTVSPQIAVISCAKNNTYGHPHPDVLATLEKFGITVLRTDETGDIRILSDGSNLSIIND